MSTDARAGVIHDIGYQRYTGPRLGRAYAVRSLYVHGLRSAFGLGRSAKAKIFPWLVIGILFFIAVVSVVIRTLSPAHQLSPSYVDFSRAGGLLTGLFLCSAAPELLSRDLRSKVLPLYFSRPVTRSDYALAKLTSVVTAAFLILAGPMLFMFICSAFSLDHASDAWSETGHFLEGLSIAAICAILYGTIATFLSSLFGRRVVAAAVIVGYFLVTIAIAGVVGGITQGNGPAFHYTLVINPAFMLEGVKQWVVGETTNFDAGTYGWWYLTSAIVLVGIGIGALLLRYRKVEA
jgi:ABC-2 type transport system permease protein